MTQDNLIRHRLSIQPPHAPHPHNTLQQWITVLSASCFSRKSSSESTMRATENDFVVIKSVCKRSWVKYVFEICILESKAEV